MLASCKSYPLFANQGCVSESETLFQKVTLQFNSQSVFLISKEIFVIEAREILKTEFAIRKNRNPNFSMRSFAKWLDVSPAQLSQMLSGKRIITLKTLKKLSNRLDLSPIERQEMINSVSTLNLGGDSDKKANFSEDQFKLIADWHHFAILSLTKIKGASADPRWIAQRLGISVSVAAEAVMRLERMGILRTKPHFEQIGDPIEMISEVPSGAIQKYHKQNLNLAMEKLETVPVEFRQFQSVSINMNLKKIKLFKKHIDEFLNLAMQQSKKDAGEEVYNLNVQLFPVTKLKENEK